jgi:hypothetical protein
VKINFWRLNEAAKKLSDNDREVSEADLLRLASNGKIKLSVLFHEGHALVRGGVREKVFKHRIESGREFKPTCLRSWFDEIPGNGFDLQGRIETLSGILDLVVYSGGYDEVMQRISELEGWRFRRINSGIFVLKGSCVFQLLDDQKYSCLREGLLDVADFVIRPEVFKELKLGIKESTESLQKIENVKKWPWGNYETELLRKTAGAVERFWTNYDPSDPSTAPTNEQVVKYLKKQDVTERTAGSIATIIRANGLPSGPRKR